MPGLVPLSSRWLLLGCTLLGCSLVSRPDPPVATPALPPPAPAARAEPGPAPEPAPVPEPAALLPATPGVDVEVLLQRLTLEQKVGQLMMVGFGGTEVDASVEALVRGRQVGGVCLFKRNIHDAQQVARLNDGLRALLDGGVPPFLTMDQEGGNVVRLHDGAVVLPGNMALGATRSAELAYEAGHAQGESLRLLGFNMNLAPVLDINVNPRNPVVGIRAYGDTPELVTRLGVQFIRGQQEAGIATVAKHFPGHGNVEADSHRALPILRAPRAEVEAQLVPFATAIREGLDGLMTAHMAIPALTGDEQPATLSPPLLTGLLRERLGFGGVVITDELEMEAIARRYGVGRAAVMSITAGADMVLIPWRPEKKAEVHEALLAAARSGELPAARLDAAVRRILTLKARRGLYNPLAPLETRLARLRAARWDVDERIARRSATLLRSKAHSLPLSPNQRIAVITAEAALARAVQARAGRARALVVPAYASGRRRVDARQKARELALDSDVVVVGVINTRQVELVTMAAAAGRPVIAVLLGLPYLAELVPEASAVLALYSYQPVSAEAAAAVLFGEQGTPGRLPVTLRRFPLGHGMDLLPQRKGLVAGEKP